MDPKDIVFGAFYKVDGIPLLSGLAVQVADLVYDSSGQSRCNVTGLMNVNLFFGDSTLKQALKVGDLMISPDRLGDRVDDIELSVSSDFGKWVKDTTYYESKDVCVFGSRFENCLTVKVIEHERTVFERTFYNELANSADGILVEYDSGKLRFEDLLADLQTLGNL